MAHLTLSSGDAVGEGREGGSSSLLAGTVDGVGVLRSLVAVSNSIPMSILTALFALGLKYFKLPLSCPNR